MPVPTIGIVGGGQLAALLVAEANRHGTTCLVLDPDTDCPAAQQGAGVVEGDRHNPADLARLAAACDVVTIEIEDVNVNALADLAEAGHRIYPRPATLQRMTNKLRQKQAMVAAGIPTSPFTPCDGEDVDVLASRGWPIVQKAAEGGYDGRGVAILNGPEDLLKRLRTPGFIEAFVPDALELSVMVARDRHGATCVYDPVEMEFDKRGNLLANLVAPARVDPGVAAAARELGVRTVDAFDGIGIFGIEMFLTPTGELLVNEVAPRTHNSGHYTIDACTASQFRQQYLLLVDAPLEDTAQTNPAVMFNLLGTAGYDGDTVVEGADAWAANPAVHLHLYGKRRCFPLRKMGHVTVVAATIHDAMRIADEARHDIIVRGAERIP